MTFFALPRLFPGALVARLALASVGLSLALSLAGCGSPEPGGSADEDADGDGADAADRADASIKPRDAGTSSKPVKDAASTPSTPSTPSPVRDAGDPLRDAGNGDPLIDAGNPLGDVVGSVDWDAVFSADGGLFTPAPPPGPASPDNPKECPETAPENPIGSCIGVPVYATCNYGSYSCLCDWIHWLCI